MTLQSHRVLSRLLDASQGFGPEYRGGLSNHLPMALVALAGLGADAARLESFYASYVARLEPLPDSEAAIDASAGASPAVLRHYRDSLTSLRGASANQDAGEVLSAALTRLQAGIGAAAFHGLIRVAYGIEAKRQDETLSGLAYWSARYLPLTDALPTSGAMQLLPWLERIATTFQGVDIAGDLIHHRMSAAAARPEFIMVLGGLDSSTLTPLDFARLAARHYVATGNFTVLHLVTSAHALYRMAPFCTDRSQLLRWYAVAYAAAVAVVGLKLERSDGINTRLLMWPEITRMAIASSDDHVIKLCHTLDTLFKLDPNPLYQLAASRRLESN